MRIEEYTLSDQERDRFLQAAMDWKRDVTPRKASARLSQSWLSRLRSAFKEEPAPVEMPDIIENSALPEEVVGRLINMVEQGTDPDAFLLHNMPMPDVLPPTTISLAYAADRDFSGRNTRAMMRRTMNYIARSMGLIPDGPKFALRDDGEAREAKSLQLHHDSLDRLSCSGTRFHFLQCLRGNAQAHTSVVTLKELLWPLDEDQVQLLLQPEYNVPRRGAAGSITRSILHKTHYGSVRFNFSDLFTTGIVEDIESSDQHQEALELFQAAYQNPPTEEVTLGPGDFLISFDDNLHGCSAYEEKGEPEEWRLLMRSHPHAPAGVGKNPTADIGMGR